MRRPARRRFGAAQKYRSSRANPAETLGPRRLGGGPYRVMAWGMDGSVRFGPPSAVVARTGGRPGAGRVPAPLWVSAGCGVRGPGWGTRHDPAASTAGPPAAAAAARRAGPRRTATATPVPADRASTPTAPRRP